MKRTTLLKSTVAIVVFAAAGGSVSPGDPPIALDPGEAAGRLASQAPAFALDPLPRPWIEEYSNSGCLEGPEGEFEWPCGEDLIELTVEGNTLYVVHSNATYNCCPDDIVICLSVQGNLLMLTEEEVLTMPCDCWCCYEVAATVVDLTPGMYTVEFCWYDYETDQEQCYVEEIQIGGGAPGPDRDDPPTGDPPVRPGGADIIDVGSSGALPIDPRPAPTPCVETCLSSGCLDDPNDPWWPPCGDDEIMFTVEGGILYVLHENAMYNCCPDDIIISLSVEGNVLLLTEEEILTEPCYCLCCYNVEATVIDLAPGTYIVEFCWFEYDTDQVECQVGEIVIP